MAAAPELGGTSSLLFRRLHQPYPPLSDRVELLQSLVELPENILTREY